MFTFCLPVPVISSGRGQLPAPAYLFRIHNRLHLGFHPANTAAEHNGSDNRADINNAAPLQIGRAHV